MLEEQASFQQSRISGNGKTNPFSGQMSQTQSLADTSNLRGKITTLEVSAPTSLTVDRT